LLRRNQPQSDFVASTPSACNAAGNIIREAPLAVWANLRQRALDIAIAEINKKTDLNITVESLERSGDSRVAALIFTIKAQAPKDGDSSPSQKSWLVGEFDRASDDSKAIFEGQSIDHTFSIDVYEG
jgi:hypothetical protein